MQEPLFVLFLGLIPFYFPLKKKNPRGDILRLIIITLLSHKITFEIIFYCTQLQRVTIAMGEIF